MRAAAEELGYEADPIARALRGGASGVVGLLVGSLADFWNQELMHAVQRELCEANRSTLVADADGEPERELELARRLVDHRVDGLIVLPVGPPSGEWESIAQEVPTVTIGDALPGVTPPGEVVFDYDRGLEATPSPPRRARPPARHRPFVGRRDVARPPRRARRRRLGRHTRARLPDRAVRVLPQRLAARSRPSCCRPPTAPRRCCAYRTRSPTACTWPAPSWGSRSRGTSRSPGSATIRSRACSILRSPRPCGMSRTWRGWARVPAPGDQRRRPAGDVAGADRAGAGGSRIDGPAD